MNTEPFSAWLSSTGTASSTRSSANPILVRKLTNPSEGDVATLRSMAAEAFEDDNSNLYFRFVIDAAITEPQGEVWVASDGAEEELKSMSLVSPPGFDLDRTDMVQDGFAQLQDRLKPSTRDWSTNSITPHLIRSDSLIPGDAATVSYYFEANSTRRNDQGLGYSTAIMQAVNSIARERGVTSAMHILTRDEPTALERLNFQQIYNEPFEWNYPGRPDIVGNDERFRLLVNDCLTDSGTHRVECVETERGARDQFWVYKVGSGDGNN
ncbi:hypothetical protein IAT38_003919 [Cryptococcus sp. DSM 104549]